MSALRECHGSLSRADRRALGSPKRSRPDRAPGVLIAVPEGLPARPGVNPRARSQVRAQKGGGTMAITWYGHELSGLPSYGLSDQGIVRRSYMLYRGRNPRAVRSEAKLIQPLSPPEIDALRR